MYHRIVESRDLSASHWTCVHADDFRKQVKLLDRWGFTAITFNDYRLFLRGELSLPRKPVILTFDDGYLDTYTTAFPVLQEFGLKGVLFVLADEKVRTNLWDRHLRLPEAPLMERRHILEMHEAGFEIGSHSMTHEKLTALTGDRVWEETSRSRILLEILLNAPVLTFSYPYGSATRMIKEIVSAAGYSIACSVATGPAAFGDDPYEIRRTAVLNTTGTRGFALRMLTPYQYYSWARWKAEATLRGVPSNGHGRPQSMDRLEPEETERIDA
jgi:peptidoglycan/xylan/chitin deacetylase (PgdA/CDA1 family)